MHALVAAADLRGHLAAYLFTPNEAHPLRSEWFCGGEGLRWTHLSAMPSSQLRIVNSLGAMFCPQCKAEYRQGFTVCADCDVPLVWQLPASPDAPHETESSGQAPEPADDPLCSFWSGDDPRIHAELCQLLDEQGIPHKTIRRQDHLFNLNSKSPFQIGIPFSCFEKAEAAVKEAYGAQGETPAAPNLLGSGKEHVTEAGIFSSLLDLANGYARGAGDHVAAAHSPPVDTPEGFSSPENSENSRRHWDPDHWYPEDATAEIWSGDQPELGELIAASLQENQIHSRLDCTEGKCALFVLPGDETRAREIVREIVEGVPPE